MYTGKDVIQDDAFLYSMWNGRLVVYKGTVVGSFQNGQARFLSFKRAHQCSLNEGEMFNAVVWFKERDDEKAKKLLIHYEITMIVNAEMKIFRHKGTIQMIETMPVMEFGKGEITK